MGRAALELRGTAFFYGTLRHRPVLRAVLGRVPATRGGILADHAIFWATDEDLPMVRPAPGATVEGEYVEGLDAEEEARQWRCGLAGSR
jgi:ADP-ribose pyrophosphatase